MPAFSPLLRLTIGLILLTVSLLLVGDLLGLAPDQRRAELAARKSIAEALAIQVSSEVGEGRMRAVADTMAALVQRSDRVLSVGLRRPAGKQAVVAGDHALHWAGYDKEKSSATHVLVPIHDTTGRWGTLEVRFVDLDGFMTRLFAGGSLAAIIAFMALAGTAVYWLFLKRALHELDPSAVVPDRVRVALDVLTEGLVILDRDEHIVLVNHAFEEKLGLAAAKLTGRKLSSLDWVRVADGEVVAEADMPWRALLETQQVPRPVQLRLNSQGGKELIFSASTAAIKGPDGRIRGVLVTFDDVTELEKRNADLRRALDVLKKSQREITRQNRELHVLATRDPLTGSLNRRSLFEGLGTLLREAREEGLPLSCIMVDIDHFKSVNDRFGHATGDKVIKMLAEILSDSVRAEDLVGRYGGEEFCVVLPGLEEDKAAQVAERMRVAVHDGKAEAFTSALRVSASFGVASAGGISLASELVDRADKALYEAKETGRNRVRSWSELGLAESEKTVSRQAESVPEPTEEMPQDGEEAAVLRQRIVALETMFRDQSDTAVRSTIDEAGLASRVVLFDRIGQAIERGRRYGMRLAVLSLEVDTVQRVSHTLGHSAAEKLVKLTAARIKGSLRSTDTVAVAGDGDIRFTVSRMGNSEFAVLLTDMKLAESATWVVKRIFTELREPIVVEGNEVLLSASIGVSLYPHDGEEAEDLLTHAGTALYEAKAQPEREAFCYYSADLNRRSKQQLQMESQLQQAIDREEMFLHYQPIVNLQTGRIQSFEALLRWRHPELGMVSPEFFIPIAEQTGAIDRIGEWVLEMACRQLKAWYSEGYEDLQVAVNLSAIQFRRADLAERVIGVMEQEQVSPRSLNLELTEQALIENLDTAVGIIERLHSAGVRVVLDDFGTGYSSLNYLKRFPIHTVKIDRSFLTDFAAHPHDTEIVNAIIAMAHGLGLEVVAEGVENQHQIQVLKRLGCDEMQGFLLSRPVSREVATDLLRKPMAIRRLVRGSGNLPGENLGGVADTVSSILNEPPQRRVLS